MTFAKELKSHLSRISVSLPRVELAAAKCNEIALLLRRDGDLAYSAIGLGATIAASRDAYPSVCLVSAVSWANALVEMP
jgi:hypothetical protein